MWYTKQVVRPFGFFRAVYVHLYSVKRIDIRYTFISRHCMGIKNCNYSLKIFSVRIPIVFKL